ncbi:MAG: SAM-dependent methyltransferase, partial [Nonomuraea sp.]|nr:SAM-dependent methyltransferase [Nonomuraea sp.]
AGAVAWYSTVHTPQEDLPVLFAEFRRVLEPGGRLLLAFKAGDGKVRLEHAYGHAVSLDIHRFQPGRVAALLAAAGLGEVARLVREADESERTPQAFLLARRPA